MATWAAHWGCNSSQSSSGSSGTSWHQKPRTVEALGSPVSLKTGSPVAGQKKFQSSRSSWISYMAVNRSELTVARPITYAAVSRAKNEAGIAASRLWPCLHQLPCSSVNWAFDTGRAGRSLGLGPFSRSGAVGAGCHRGTSNTHLNPSSSPRAASRIGPCAPLGRPCHLAAAGRWGWGSLPSPDGCPAFPLCAPCP